MRLYGNCIYLLYFKTNQGSCVNIEDHLLTFIKDSHSINTLDEYRKWLRSLKGFVEGAIGEEFRKKIEFQGNQFDKYNRAIDAISNLLKGYLAAQENKNQAKLNIKAHRIFLSHGRSEEWRSVQSFIEKDLDLKTMELSQQVNAGRVVIQKLHEESAGCDYAVIIMTGDDAVSDGEKRARENVMHEIGFFQGKFGLNAIVLLHEEGVNIPSNLSGIVYISFPSKCIKASFSELQRELRAFYGLNVEN